MSEEQLNKNNDNSEQQVVRCQRCGRLSAAAPISIDESTKKEYFRCLLGQRPFSKTVKMFSGAVEVTFEEPSAAVQRRLESYTGTSQAVMDDMNLIGSIKELIHVDTDTGNSTVIYSATVEDRLASLADPASAIDKIGLSSVELTALRRVCGVFYVLLGTLAGSVLTDDFFAGVGLS